MAKSASHGEIVDGSDRATDTGGCHEWAVTVNDPPATRLMGNLPPSISGKTRSTITRCLPSVLVNDMVLFLFIRLQSAVGLRKIF